MEKITDEKTKAIEAYRQELKTVSRLVLADEIPEGESVDVLIFNTRAVGDTSRPGRPGNDETGLFEYVGKLFESNSIKNVLLFGSDGQNWDPKESIKSRYERGADKMKANAGVSEYLRKLSLICGIRLDNIFFAGVEMGNVREENVVAARELEQHKDWKSAASITHPHQSLRNAAGHINENKSRGLEVKMYFIHPERTWWEEEVYGSQSQHQMLRKDHALPEMQRLVKYTVELGNLATPNQILDYLKHRDGSLNRLNILLEKKMKDPNFIRDVEVMEKAIDSLNPQELEKLPNLFYV